MVPRICQVFGKQVTSATLKGGVWGCVSMSTGAGRSEEQCMKGRERGDFFGLQHSGTYLWDCTERTCSSMSEWMCLCAECESGTFRRMQTDLSRFHLV